MNEALGHVDGSGQPGFDTEGSPKQTETPKGLSFGQMLERFYRGQSPPDPTDPESYPPANLDDRRQR